MCKIYYFCTGFETHRLTVKPQVVLSVFSTVSILRGLWESTWGHWANSELLCVRHLLVLNRSYTYSVIPMCDTEFKAILNNLSLLSRLFFHKLFLQISKKQSLTTLSVNSSKELRDIWIRSYWYLGTASLEQENRLNNFLESFIPIKNSVMKTQEFLSVPAVPILKMLLLCYGSALFFWENWLCRLTPGHLEQNNLVQLHSSEHQRSYLLCYGIICLMSLHGFLQSPSSQYFQHSMGDIFISFLKFGFFQHKNFCTYLKSIQAPWKFSFKLPNSCPLQNTWICNVI